MRISDWSSDVCSSDLKRCSKAPSAGKPQCGSYKDGCGEYQSPGDRHADHRAIIHAAHHQRTADQHQQQHAIDQPERLIAVHFNTTTMPSYPGTTFGGSRSEEHTSELKSLMPIS